MKIRFRVKFWLIFIICGSLFLLINNHSIERQKKRRAQERAEFLESTQVTDFKSNSAFELKETNNEELSDLEELEESLAENLEEEAEKEKEPEEELEEKILLDDASRVMIYNYFQENISKLSPQKEVLGGKFYISSIDFNNPRKLIISYEDGHLFLTAIVQPEYSEEKIAGEEYRKIKKIIKINDFEIIK